MVEKTWPALKSCKHQCYEASNRLSQLADDTEANNRLFQLPDDNLSMIMSSLTMKEAARTSVISHRMNYMWRCFPALIFEDCSAMRRIAQGSATIYQESSRFVRWVNQVVEAHLGPIIDELRVTFNLTNSCQSDFDKWVVFALAKQVKILELNFTPASIEWQNTVRLGWPISLCQPHNLAVFKSCLRFLCLKYVDVTAKDIECLLLSCSVLENLCIVSSPSLTHVRVLGSFLQLKHLEVSNCPRLETIDILAPKLLSFTNHGRTPVELHIRNANLLSKVSVGDTHHAIDIISNAFDPLWKYFSQLEYVCLRMRLMYQRTEYNKGISNPPALTNLKHLELHVRGWGDQSLLGWADLIEACPLLQRLAVKISTFDSAWCSRKIVKRNGRPLKSLKTLEFRCHLGIPIDLEFVTYVVENSVMLEDVTVEFRQLLGPLSKYKTVHNHDAELKSVVDKLPQGVKLTMMQPRENK